MDQVLMEGKRNRIERFVNGADRMKPDGIASKFAEPVLSGR